MKNTSVWCEQKWPKTAAIFPLESNPRSLLLCHENLSDTDVTIHATFKTEAAQQISIRNPRFVCERKHYPIYVFGAGTRAIRYSVDIRSLIVLRGTAFHLTSEPLDLSLIFRNEIARQLSSSYSHTANM